MRASLFVLLCAFAAHAPAQSTAPAPAREAAPRSREREPIGTRSARLPRVRHPRGGHRVRGEIPPTAASRQAVTRTAILFAAFVLAAGALAASPVRIAKTWTGRMPASVPPLLQSSVASQDGWKSVWATCQMQGAAPDIDFDKQLVLVAVRQSSVVTFSDVRLDGGNLVTNVIVAPDKPNRMTCALALVAREGVTSVNGAPVGK